MSSKKVKISLDNKNIEVPMIEGTLGYKAIDTSTLNKEHLFSYDPGFTSTAACKSAITFVDGEKGELLYRGYPIEQLAEKCDFLDVAFLLFNGELPTFKEKELYSATINGQSLLHDQLNNVFRGFRRDAHPMAVMVGVVGSMAAFYFDNMNINNRNHRKQSANKLLAKVPTIAAWSHTYNLGLPFVYPKHDLGYVANASTSTVRLVGSTGANPYACIASGIASLWGPAHGGANEATLKMLNEIKNESRINEYIKRAKDKNDDFRLMGFGHRVYRNRDPRAEIMKVTCHEVLDELGLNNEPLFKLAITLEKIALEDEYFIEKKLYPNVDFYSGIVMKALGIPNSMFTAIFALARTAGWIAHWHEMMTDSDNKIGRPRQIYTGRTQRDIP